MAQLAQDVRRRIAEMGASFNPDILEATKSLFSSHWPAAQSDVVETRDSAYGAHARQRLDIFAPTENPRRATLLYVPGGGFTGGDKSGYTNIGRFVAANGITCVVINYRLAPDDPWPAGAEDVKAAVTWTHDHVTQLGGDRDRIAVFGQSAGAAHVAAQLWDHRFRMETPPNAVVLASGVYRIEEGQVPPNVAAYYGDDASQYADRSPYTHVDASRCPILLSLAEFDPAYLAAPTLELAARLCRADGRSPRLVWQAGENHVSTVLAIGTPFGGMGPLLMAFLSSVFV